MRKLWHLILSPLILLAIAFGAYRWADTLQRSIRAYTSPLAGTSMHPAEQMAPQTHRVVLVVVSGLSYQQTIVQDMPLWQRLAAVGASAAVTVQPPAYWPSVWTTLLTGAGPELNNAPVLDPGISGVRPITPDNLLVAARDAGLRTAIAASSDRALLLPASTADATFFTQEVAAAADAQVVEAALGFIADQQYNLIIVHLNQLAETGRAQGTGSQAYAGALRQIDSYLRQITRQMSLSDSVLMLTSDGALLGDGRPAGGENDPPSIPLVIAGQRVVVGDYSPVQLTDVAPTIAALLGTRPPTAAQGQPLFAMLQIETEALANDQLRLATQKVSLGESYATAIGPVGLSQTINRDLMTAAQSLQSGNRSGALELARLVSEEIAGSMASARLERVAGERNPRLLPFAVGVVVPLLWFWARRPYRVLLSATSALVALAVFYGLYRLEGHTFSFTDTLGAYAHFGIPLARNVAVALIAGALLLMIGLLSDDQRRWLARVSTVYDYAIIVCYLSLIPVLFAYWQNGAWITWYLPHPTTVVIHALALQEIAIAATMSAVAPWLLGAIVWAVERRRARAGSRRTQVWDPIAHLRR